MELFTDKSGRYWGQAGAGGIFYSEDTCRYLFSHRSEDVNEPNTWGTWGGQIDSGENPEEALRREIAEETGYFGTMELKPIFIFQDGEFRFYNYLIVVPKEFDPNHSWETQGHIWTTLEKLPEPLHFGSEELLSHLKDKESELHKSLSKIIIPEQLVGNDFEELENIGKSIAFKILETYQLKLCPMKNVRSKVVEINEMGPSNLFDEGRIAEAKRLAKNQEYQFGINFIYEVD